MTRPVRVAGEGLGRLINDVKRQAPGARMVGEFAVKMGLTELGKRLSPHKPDDE